MMYNTDTALLVAIFLKAHPLRPDQSTTEYLQYFECAISETGIASERLGLAGHDKKLIFCWNPTPRLIRLIVDRGVRRWRVIQKTTTLNDQCLVASILNRDDDTREATEFSCQVLAVLGLLNEGADQRWKPTRLMQQFIFERCMCAKDK
jgi:hypothetical protein